MKKPVPRPLIKLEELTLEEFQKLFPKDESGALAARLLQRYLYTLLIHSSLGAECNAVTAQSEAGANKALARLVRDFSILDTAPPKKEARKPLKPLNRHVRREETNETEPQK